MGTADFGHPNWPLNEVDTSAKANLPDRLRCLVDELREMPVEDSTGSISLIQSRSQTFIVRPNAAPPNASYAASCTWRCTSPSNQETSIVQPHLDDKQYRIYVSR